MKFYTDVLKDKLVLISFIYTNCTDICPTLMHTAVPPGVEASPDGAQDFILVEELVILMLVVAVLVGIAAHRLRAPYTIGWC